MTFIKFKKSQMNTDNIYFRQKKKKYFLYILMYTVQYKFFFFLDFFNFFFLKAVDSQCHSVANALKRAVFVRGG